MDDLDFEPTVPVCLAGRFRPKVKPKSTKIASAAAITEFPNVVTENSIPVSSTVSDSDPSATSVDPVGSSSVTSETLGSLEPSGNNDHLYSSVLSFHGDRIIKPSESAAADSFQPLANGSDGSQSIFRKSASKNADELSGLECLEDCLTKSTNGAAPVSDNEKPVQKRKRTKKAPDEPTKKFSHSTCRNRRRDKSLTEMPEDEIDPKKIPLRDLIRLRELQSAQRSKRQPS